MRYRIRHEIWIEAGTEKEAFLMWQLYSMQNVLANFPPKVDREDEVPVAEGGTKK